MKKFFLGLLALMVSATLFAAPRTMEEAAAIAAQFTNSQQQLSRVHKTPRKAENMRFVHRVAKPNSAEDAFFIFNQADNSGFVIVSADDNAVTILGYSDEGAFDATNIPSNVQFWFDFVAERIADTKAGARRNDMQRVRKATKVAAISPLLGNIKWDQGTPYNNLCPMDKTTRAYTGCVATAAAQIMKMYNWPETGQGSHTDQWKSDAGKQGTSTADFGATTYEWANMLDTYKSGSYTTEQANAVATLMFHVGVACDMQFGGDESNGSGAYTDDMGNALVTYFRYKNTAQYKSGLSNSQLTTLFNTELEAGRPILMGGSNNEGGHEFVCDGRDGNGLFHINWGWGGTSNGHFALNGLDPDQQGAGGSSAGYNQQIDCVIGIEPDKDPVYVTGVTVTPTAQTLKIKETQQLTATVSPADASNKGLGWTSSNENIVTVSASGVVKGIATGSATITATTFDGNKTATCTVTVTDEVALPTLLEVDKARAEYDDQYEEPWTIDVYKSNTELVPYVRFWPDGKQTSKIAGTYTFTGQGGYLWNNMSDPDESKKITTGQLVITCVGSGDGAHGCNTYRVLSYFTCEDDSEYKIDATLEICAQDTSGTSVDLTDAVGTQPYVVTWEANGETFAENIANNGKLVLPTDQPGNCENGKVFVGWSKTDIDETDDAPTFAQNGDAVTANTTYYAVYATAEGGVTPTKTTLTMSDYEAASGTFGNFTFAAAKNDGATAPTYNGTGADVRLYAQNTLAISSASEMTKIVFNISTQGLKRLAPITASTGTIATQKSGDSEVTWTGSATSVTFTVGDKADYGTESSKAGQLDFTSVEITAGSANYTGYTTSCGAAAEKYGITINPAANGSLATSPAAEAAAGKTVTITATPATHYHLATLSVEGATSHTAVAVSGTGNTRTFVMPAEAVTVSGTFALDDKVTVRFIDKGEEISSEQYFIGETATKPANPSAGCDEYEFAGWYTAAVTESTTEKPALVTNFTVTKDQDYYAIYSKTETEEGGSTAFDGSTPGTYKIYADVNGTKYYAKSVEALSSSNKKITSTTTEAEAVEYTFTKVEGGFTISNGDNYLSYGTSGTNINLVTTPYTWNIAASTSGKGTWRVKATTGTNRALAFSASSATNVFGGYSTSNIGSTVQDATYYDVEIGGSGPVSTTYYSSVVTCSGTVIENTQVEGEKAIKRIENGQIVIIRGNEKYTIFGQKIQ